MRDPKRIEEILSAIRDAWNKYPDLRLCQLLQNGAYQHGHIDKDLFYFEDGPLLDSLKKYVRF